MLLEKTFQPVQEMKSRNDWLLSYRLLLYFPMFSKKFHTVKCHFFPTPTRNWLLIIPAYIFRWHKGKNKKRGHWLALKVLIRFKIELFYCKWKPVIWKYNFWNSLNVQRSSRNIKFNSYREKGNPLFYI